MPVLADVHGLLEHRIEAVVDDLADTAGNWVITPWLVRYTVGTLTISNFS